MQTLITYKDLNFGDIDKAARDFKNQDFVLFPNMITAKKANDLYNFIFIENKKHVVRRDFMMASSNTPRHMWTVSGYALNTFDPIKSLYIDRRMLHTLNRIAYDDAAYSIGQTEKGKEKRRKQGRVIPYWNNRENMVATELRHKDDTHGHHYDVPPLALIFCLKAPPPKAGGDVEFEMKNKKSRVLTQIHLNKGDTYLMRTDRTLHGVLPLLKNTRRSILNLTYSYKGHYDRPDNSAEQLFEGPH